MVGPNDSNICARCEDVAELEEQEREQGDNKVLGVDRNTWIKAHKNGCKA